MNFFSFFKRRRQFPSWDGASQLPEFRAAFSDAVRFTRYCGFPADDLTRGSSDCLDPSGEFFQSIVTAAGLTTGEGLAGQCLKWCHFLQPFAEQVLQKRVWLTLGQLWKGEKWLFAPSFADLERWMTQGFSMSDFAGKQGLDFHAWLTVETGEIIEPTFMATLAAVHPEIFGEMPDTVVWGRDPEVLLGHRYVPMLIGCEAAEKISAMSPMPLLARNSNELRFSSSAFVIRG